MIEELKTIQANIVKRLVRDSAEGNSEVVERLSRALSETIKAQSELEMASLHKEHMEFEMERTRLANEGQDLMNRANKVQVAMMEEQIAHQEQAKSGITRVSILPGGLKKG